MTKEVGFVVKSFFPKKQKLCVLTKHSGKVLLAVRLPQGSQTISVGSLIEYQQEPFKHMHMATRITVLYVPLVQAKVALYWLHHVLEICYYFAPLHVPNEALFCFLQDIYTYAIHESLFAKYRDKIKKIALLKLFTLLGFYPQQKHLFFLSSFEAIKAISIDSPNIDKVRSLHESLEKIHSKTILELDAWLLQCLHEHPNIISFKTVAFFDVM